MAGLVPPTTSTSTTPQQVKKEEEKVDYFNLPCPIPYEEIHREAFSLSLSLFFFQIFMLFFYDF
jgi:mitochondrial import receptor subunit TOM40